MTRWCSISIPSPNGHAFSACVDEAIFQLWNTVSFPASLQALWLVGAGCRPVSRRGRFWGGWLNGSCPSSGAIDGELALWWLDAASWRLNGMAALVVPLRQLLDQCHCGPAKKSFRGGFDFGRENLPVTSPVVTDFDFVCLWLTVYQFANESSILRWGWMPNQPDSDGPTWPTRSAGRCAPGMVPLLLYFTLSAPLPMDDQMPGTPVKQRFSRRV